MPDERVVVAMAGSGAGAARAGAAGAADMDSGDMSKEGPMMGEGGGGGRRLNKRWVGS